MELPRLRRLLACTIQRSTLRMEVEKRKIHHTYHLRYCIFYGIKCVFCIVALFYGLTLCSFCDVRCDLFELPSHA